ncbi:MAG: hypothetical protein RI958_2567 [Actinomycetota bacterium]
MPAPTIDTATTVITVAVLAFMVYRLIGGIRVSRTQRGRLVVRAVRQRIGWRHVWPVPLVLTAVLVAAGALVQVPVMSWGWWSALGGVGNPVFGSTTATEGTLLEWVVPLVFMALLVPALPLFAHAEERMFRAGAEHWSRRRRVLKTLQFGAVHAVIGIPIGVAIALSIGGAYFMRVYLREFRRSGSRAEATAESATAHTVYNGVIIGIVIIGFVVDLLLP